MRETNWIVITGAPCSGKTSVINALADRGYRVAPEVARAYMEELFKAHTIEEVDENILELQQHILESKLKRENELPEGDLIFFDRGLPDSIAYYQTRDLPTAEVIAACRKRRYKKVFIFDRLPFQEDSIRHENPELAELLDKLIREAYQLLEYDFISVPVMSIEERTQFVLDEIDGAKNFE